MAINILEKEIKEEINRSTNKVKELNSKGKTQEANLVNQNLSYLKWFKGKIERVKVEADVCI